jgi:hypothetical protein
MVDLDDVDLRDSAEEPLAVPPRGSGGGLAWTIASAAVLVVALVIVSLWLLHRTEPSPTPTPEATPPVPSTPTASPTPVATPELPLPALGESDDLVRALAGPLSSHARFAAWLQQKQLMRRFVAIVSNVAEGRSPRPHLLFLAPEGRFAVTKRGGLTVIAPESYARYDLIGDVAESIDPERFARVFAALLPLGEAAHRELGHPPGTLTDTVQRAVGEMLAVPANVSAPAVAAFQVGPLTQYRYVDPKLEGLSPAQKNLLRMGPRNVTRIQARLRAALSALDPLIGGRPVAAGSPAGR